MALPCHERHHSSVPEEREGHDGFVFNKPDEGDDGQQHYRLCNQPRGFATHQTRCDGQRDISDQRQRKDETPHDARRLQTRPAESV